MGSPHTASPPTRPASTKNADDMFDKFEKVDTSSIQKFVEIRGDKINYAKVGTGAHGLLLFNGSMGRIDSDFGLILSKFSKDFTVVAWEYPGCGKSSPPARDFTSKATFFHNDADFGYELMKKLGFKKFSVLGWCGGGVNAIFISVKYPESVQKLIVCGTRSHFTEKDITFYRVMADPLNWSAEVKSGLMGGYDEEYFLKCWKGLNDLYFKLYDDEGGNLCNDELGQIKCPTLIIHGDKDPVCPVNHAHYLHQNIPNSKLITMAAGKHNLHLRYTEEFIGYVEEFVLGTAV